MAVEMVHNLGRYAEEGGDLISPQFQALMADGRAVPAAAYLDAVEDARAMRGAFGELFEQACTAIITPATLGVAPVGQATGDPSFCSLWSLTGLPAVTLPLLSGDSGLPLGVQLVGAMDDDARLLRTANWLVARLAG
jgi:Asp-tRNA(Asn)/Glu-tRNA(Gln) amidotransferase A subunit family amidase